MQPLRRILLGAVGALLLAGVLAVAPGATGQSSAGDAVTCSTSIQQNGNSSLNDVDHRNCMIAIGSAYLGAEEGTTAAEDVPLDPEVARYSLGSKPAHQAGGDAAIRDGWAAGHVGAVTDPEWTVDGTMAFVTYEVRSAPSGPIDHHVAARLTIRNGLIWEILVNPTTGSNMNVTPSTTRTPFHPATAVVGPVADPVDMSAPNYDSAPYCTLAIGDGLESQMTQDQHRRCLVAIAATYVEAEGNSAPDSETIFDPRFSKYSLGDWPNHHSGNGDTNRTDQTALSPTIRLITNKVWTADTTTDQVWITYDGYLPVSTDKPGFYVAERLTIRNGLIWEIEISPVAVDIPASLVPGGPPTLG